MRLAQALPFMLVAHSRYGLRHAAQADTSPGTFSRAWWRSIFRRLPFLNTLRLWHYRYPRIELIEYRYPESNLRYFVVRCADSAACYWINQTAEGQWELCKMYNSKPIDAQVGEAHAFQVESSPNELISTAFNLLLNRVLDA